MAHDLAGHGIRVSIIEPGVTRTAILGKNSDAPQDSAYGGVYGRMFDMYASGIVADVKAEVVAETIQEAIEAPPGQLRWACAWGADQMRNGRPFTDEQLIELGELAADGPAWREKFHELYGLDLISAGMD